jgi:hypothetical protein
LSRQRFTTARQFLRQLWSILSWIALVVIVCAVIGAWYFYHRSADELRASVERRLAAMLPTLSVSIGDARFVQSEGIRVSDVSLIQPASGNRRTRAEIAFADEIFLACNPSVTDLIHGQVQIQRVYIRGLTLRPIRYADGSTNLDSLVSLARSPKQKLPMTIIEEGTIELIDRKMSPGSLMSLSHVNVRIRGKHQGAGTGRVRRTSIDIEGTFSADHFQKASVHATIDPAERRWLLEGDVKNVRFDRACHSVVPEELSYVVSAASGLTANADIDFQVGRPDPQSALAFRVTANVRDGRYESPELQHVVTDINANLTLANDSWQITDLAANYGTARIDASIRRDGYGERDPTVLNAKMTNLLVNRQLVESLPDSVQALWNKFQPLGLVSGSAIAAFDGHRWTIDASVECEDVSLLYHKFPYPVAQCRGKVNFKHDHLEFQLAGHAGTTPVTIHGALDNPGPNPSGWCDVKTLGWLPFDDLLFQAVEKKHAPVSRFLRELKLRGQFGLIAKYRKERTETGPLKPSLIVNLKDAWLEYMRFPYAINDIRGVLTLADGRWNFKDLEGFNGGCLITCQGSYDLHKARDPLWLDISATNLSLDDELKSGFSPEFQQLWAHLRPRGSIDRVDVQIAHTPGQPAPRLVINAAKLARTEHSVSDDLRMQPAWFPLRFEGLSGNATYRNGIFELHQFVANYKSTTLTADVFGKIDRQGPWNIEFRNLVIRGIQPHDEIVAAMPKSLAKAVRQLELEGCFGLNGSFGMQGDRRSKTPATKWNILLDMDQASFRAGIPLTHAYGQLRLRGRNEGKGLMSSGELQLDSVFYDKVQLTDVHGPLRFDRQQVILGSDAVAANVGQPLQARVHEGKLSLDAVVQLGTIPEFHVNSQLINANIGSLARDLAPQHRNLTGRVSGRLSLSGSGINSLQGQGRVQLTEANLYELPLILAVLQRLRYGNDDTSAFTASDLAFRVQGRDIYFDHCDLIGDTITLKGIGWIGGFDAERELRLDFYSIVGREHLWMPVVRPLLGEASRQFMLVKVRGSLDDPNIRQEILPGLNETLQRLFPELAELPAQRQARRSLLPLRIFR